MPTDVKMQPETVSTSLGEVVVRDYDFKLHQSACERLHELCPLGKTVQFHIKSSDHSSRAQYREGWHCLVAETTTKDQASLADGAITKEGRVLLATFSCALVPWKLDGKSLKAGTSFDLRVHPAFRRQGLGNLLGSKVLEILKKKGCDFAVGQTVATTPFLEGKCLGGKNLARFNTISWPACTSSCISRWLFFQNYPTLVRCLQGEEAATFLRQHFDSGLSLGDLDALTKDKAFKGTFVATRNDSTASVSLFSLRESHSYVLSKVPVALRLCAKIGKWFTGVKSPELDQPFFVSMAFGLMQQGPESETLLREVLAEVSSVTVDDEAATLLYCVVPSGQVDVGSFKSLLPTRISSATEMILGVKTLSEEPYFEMTGDEKWLIDPRPW